MAIEYAKACSQASLMLEGGGHPEVALLLQMAATEIERLNRAENLLRDANDKLRSAHAIASRDGVSTNWAAFRNQVTASLVQQSVMLNGTAHADAATCTAKTFRLPPSERGKQV